MVTQHYPPLVGGVERHVHVLSHALVARGHDVSVATLWHSGLPAEESEGPVRVRRFRATLHRLPGVFTTERFHAPPLPDPEATRALQRIVSRERPDVVHAHDWLSRSFVPIRRSMCVPLVRTLHDHGLNCVQFRRMYRGERLCAGPGLGRCTACAMHCYGIGKGLAIQCGSGLAAPFERSRTDLFLAVSRSVADLSGLVTSRALHEVIPNFLPDADDEVFDASDPRLAQLPEQPFILQAGDVVPDKGVGVLLEAYAGLQWAPPLVLIGRRAGPWPTTVPPGVTLLPPWPHALVMEAWRRSLFGIVASILPDACPTVVLEAMAMRRAIVASRIGGIVDLAVDDETALLVPPNDAAALRAAMQRLAADPPLRSRLGRAGSDRVARFRVGAVVGRIEAGYERVISLQRAASA